MMTDEPETPVTPPVQESAPEIASPAPAKRPRGRPRKTEEQKADPATSDAPVAAGSRRRRAKIGTPSLKLTAPERKGYKRRFAMATPERIAELEELGYSKVVDASIPTSGLGSGTVQRPAGTGEDGQHYRHILMETPDELYAQGRDELEAHNRKVDDAIATGRDRTGHLSQGESYGEGHIKVSRG